MQIAERGMEKFTASFIGVLKWLTRRKAVTR